MLNKTDLVTPEELRDVEATVRAINPAARIHRTTRAGVDLAEVLDRGAFDLEARAGERSAFPRGA